SAPNPTGRARKPVRAKAGEEDRASAFAQAADVVAGTTKSQPGATASPAGTPKGAETRRTPPGSPVPVVNVEQLAGNVARLIEESGKAFAAYLKPREEGQVKGEGTQVVEIVKTLGQVAEYWLRDPQRALELQTSIGRTYLDLWASAMRRMTGE